MCRSRFVRSMVFVLAIGLAGGRLPIATAQAVLLDSRETVVRLLKHQESLVRSAECEMEVSNVDARPEMVPLIEEVCRLNGRPNNFKFTEDFARVNSYAMHWWRSGAKERYNKSWLDGRTEQGAFDGQVVRQHNNKDRGAVHTVDSSHWASSNRQHPYSLLYTYYERPFSEVIEQGTNFHLTQEQREGEPVSRVQFNDRNDPTFFVALLFSTDGRVVERQIIGPRAGNPKASTWEIHVLSDYKAHSTTSGETIWFPSQAVYHYYMGEHPTAGLVEWQTKTISIKNIKFNVDIPDDFFSLRIPRNATVWDGISGLGDLKPYDRPERLFPEEARRKRWITVSIVIAIALALTFGIVWRRKRRRRIANV